MCEDAIFFKREVLITFVHACYVKQLKNGRFELEQPLKFACMDYEALLYVGHLREMFINADFEMHTVCILYLATLTLIFLILNNLIVKYKSIHIGATLVLE